MKSIIASITVATGLMIAGSAMADDMPPLAKQHNCTACHAIDHKVVGPAWVDVAKKYKGAKTYKYSARGSADTSAKELPLVEGLMVKVSKGGSGNWGSMPMIANDPAAKSQADIKKLVEFILGLAK